MTKLLIDLDLICYRAAFACEKTKYLVLGSGPEFQLGGMGFDDAKAAKESAFSNDTVVWSRKEVQPEDTAVMIAQVMVKDIKDHYASENPTCIGYLSGVGNYRHGIATRANYKSGRAAAPVHLKAIRTSFLSNGVTVLSVGEEADDLIGIAATQLQGSCVVCSLDKDLKQLPGRHYDFVKKEEVTISPKEAWLNFYSQVISGDSTDNVPGLTGYGPVKARKALEGCKNNRACWLKVIELYKHEFGPLAEAYALECAQLVYVRRSVGDMFNAPSAIAVAA